MDTPKVSAVAEWATPCSRKEVQRFLVSPIFIGNLSASMVPLLPHCVTCLHLTKLLSGPKIVKPPLTASRRASPQHPLLTLPDPCQQFIVAVDASDLGVDAILSQINLGTGKLHPCAFLSQLSLRG